MPARRSMTKRIVLGFAIVGMSTLLAQPPRREGDPVLFEGARLITGDGGAAIERSGTEHVELEHMVSAGLTPSDAIVAATRTAADILDSIVSAPSRRPRAPTSSSSTRTRSTASRTRGGSPACTCEAPRSRV